VTEDLERFGFNVSIAKLMELTNEMTKTLAAGGGAREAAEALVLLLAPLGPFLAEELWREALGNDTSVHAERWPVFDPELARQDHVVLVVQVDGKVRDKFDVSPDILGPDAERLAMESDRVRRALDGRTVARIVSRPPRVVNLVTAPS
jgi:leucyl-tRNA synthetase